ncbi:21616_t:CDS:2 [Entrophospora sp. SA101]|nr:21616_t:CDS:2 [Entrophospora sp. SA101]
MPSCKKIREELIDCMLKSDCVLVKRLTIKASRYSLQNFFIEECFKPENYDDVPRDCHSIRKSFFECRRGTMSNLKKTRKEYRKVLTNDELFYDPDVDDVNELWMQRKLSKHNKTSSDQKTSTTPTNETDAILSCPMCFTILKEIYYPVECLNCGTKVAVMDVEEHSADVGG